MATRDKPPGKGPIVGIGVSRKRGPKLDSLSPYAAPFMGADLKASMLIAEMSKAQVCMMFDVSPRAVEYWITDERPIPVVVRKVMRGIALGLLPRRVLEAL